MYLRTEIKQTPSKTTLVEGGSALGRRGLPPVDDAPADGRAEVVGVGAAECQEPGIPLTLEVGDHDLLGPMPDGHNGFGPGLTPAFDAAVHGAGA